MNSSHETQHPGFRAGRFYFLIIFLLMVLGLFYLARYKHYIADREVNITTIEDEGIAVADTDTESLKAEIQDVYQINGDREAAASIDEESINRVMPESAGGIIDLTIRLDALSERLEILEKRVSEFTNVAVNVPNYQQLIITIIDIEEAIKKGQSFASSVLKMRNLTRDPYITSRVEIFSKANFLQKYGHENLQNLFKESLMKYDASLVLTNDTNSVWHKFLGDFIVIKKVNNFGDGAEDLIDQAEIYLHEGHMRQAVDNLKLLDEERYKYFEDYIRYAERYLEALRLTDEIKSYLNI